MIGALFHIMECFYVLHIEIRDFLNLDWHFCVSDKWDEISSKTMLVYVFKHFFKTDMFMFAFIG